MGLCSSIGMVIVVAVSITNTTALLALFPKFFMGIQYNFWDTDFLNSKRSRTPAKILINTEEIIQKEPAIADASENRCKKYFSIHAKQSGKFDNMIKKFVKKLISK